MRLTAKSPTSLSLDGAKDRAWFDDDISGFGIRMREGGSSTWIYRYRKGSKQYSIGLGSTKVVSFALARDKARDYAATVQLRGNPAEEMRKAKSEAENTFGAVARQYYEAKERDWRPKSQAAAKRALFDYAAGLHPKPITAITQRDIALLLNQIAASSGDVTANRLRANLCGLWAWAIRQGLPLTNVASLTEKKRETARDRVLSESELAAIWRNCGDDNLGRVLKLLILTGQRENEIALLRWDEVHDDEIILSSDRVKNKRTHVVPLTKSALELIGPRSNHRTHVFGRDDTGYQSFGSAKPRLDKRLGIPPWRIHDIRRSVVTHMAEKLGIQPHIIEAVINHVSGHKAGVAGIYNRASYSKEKRDALNLWAEHVAKITT